MAPALSRTISLLPTTWASIFGPSGNQISSAWLMPLTDRPRTASVAISILGFIDGTPLGNRERWLGESLPRQRLPGHFRLRTPRPRNGWRGGIHRSRQLARNRTALTIEIRAHSARPLRAGHARTRAAAGRAAAATRWCREPRAARACRTAGRRNAGLRGARRALRDASAPLGQCRARFATSIVLLQVAHALRPDAVGRAARIEQAIEAARVLVGSRSGNPEFAASPGPSRPSELQTHWPTMSHALSRPAWMGCGRHRWR